MTWSHRDVGTESLDMLGTAILVEARDGFTNLPEAELSSKSGTASFRWYPNSANPVALVKVFTGGTAESLYHQEAAALHSLRRTGRVCFVLCNSASVGPTFWNKKDVVPYFIAKRYYPKKLTSALITATGLEKLDIAAQEIDIARQFLGCGWRDFDWSLENDVICEDGKILRVDLDSASALGAWIEKSTIGDPSFFSLSENAALQKFLAQRETILKGAEANKLTNMAIRLSHYVFINNNDRGELAELLEKLQPHAKNSSSERSTGRLSRHIPRFLTPARSGGFTLRLLSTLLSPPKVNGADHSNDQASERGGVKDNFSYDSKDVEVSLLFDKWVDLWLRQSPSRMHSQPSPQTLAKLTYDELGLLARLFYHLIANPGHGFTLDDFRTSILLLAVAALCERKPFIESTSRSEPDLIEQLSPHTRLFEVKTILFPEAPPASNTNQGTSAQHITSRKPELSKLLKVETIPMGGQWPATTKGISHVCQDRALKYAGEHFVTAGIVDGVSDAAGLQAASIIERGFNEWCGTLKAGSPEELSRGLRDFISNMDAALNKESKFKRESHEAVMAIAVASWRDNSCFAWVAKAGEDSDCEILSPDESLMFSTKRFRTPRLGSGEYLNKDSIKIWPISLVGSGPYRFRLFSDGIGVPGYKRLREIKDIEALVNEASAWGEALSGAVGTDDWSVAGFDILIEETAETVIGQTEGDALESSGLSAEVKSEQSFLAAAISKADPAKIYLNGPAKIFWRKALGAVLALEDRTESAGLRFIGDVVGEPIRTDVTDRKTARRPQVATSGLPASKPFFDEQTIKIVLTVLLLSGLIVGAIVHFSSSPQTSDQSENRRQDISTPTPTEEPEVDTRFDIDQQNKIFNSLRTVKGTYEINNLPIGASVGGAVFNALLRDLAAVLSKTKWNVSVEIYTDMTGSSNETKRLKDNLKTSVLRASALSDQFKRLYRDIAPRVKFDGMGETPPKIVPEVTEIDRGLNRRIVIRRVS